MGTDVEAIPCLQSQIQIPLCLLNFLVTAAESPSPGHYEYFIQWILLVAST